MSYDWPTAVLSKWLNNASAILIWEGNTKLPISVAMPARQKNACYIHSPRSAWFDYLAHECRSWPISALLIQILGKLSYFLGIDKTVYVGNYPISTSIWTKEQEGEILRIANKIRQSHPDYYIGVRNLLPHRHPTLITELKSLGFSGIPSRVIYEFDLRGEKGAIPSHLKRDLSLLKKLNLDVEICTELDHASLVRIHALYQKIYLDKHSPLNPQYTTEFFKDMVNQGPMSCLLIRGADQQIRSFALILATGQTISVPALGYDLDFALEGSYRVLFAAIYVHSKNKQVLLNYSSGAGDFKRKRGGVAHLEYTYIRCPLNSGSIKKQIIHFAARKTQSIQAQDLIQLGA